MTEEEILQLAQKIEGDSKQEEAEHAYNMPLPYLNYPIKEKLIALTHIKAMLKEVESNE